MHYQRRSIRLGAAVLIFAVILRLGGGITSGPHVWSVPVSAQTNLQRWPQGGMADVSLHRNV